MLSISLPMKGAGHANYYLQLARQDYYTAQGHEPGRWFGRGAEALELRGEVQGRAFENLLWGRSPDGRCDLVQNAGDRDRQTAWDLTLSAPKSVSVVWALGSAEVRAQIESAHHRAVAAALQFLEETAGWTRRGQGGQRFERARLAFATFTHYSSRAQDPQIHSHCLLLNLAVREDGTTGALWSKEMFRAKKAAGAVYQVEFAAGLRPEPGLVTQPDRIGFQIEGVSREVCRLFSQRRQDIEKALDERGAHDAVTAKAVALDTRPGKVNVPRETLIRSWQTRAEPCGWNEARVMSLVHRCPAQSCTQRALVERFRDEAARLPDAKQTPGRLRGLAARLAVEMGADARQFRPLLRLIHNGQLERPQPRAGQCVSPAEQSNGKIPAASLVAASAHSAGIGPPARPDQRAEPTHAPVPAAANGKSPPPPSNQARPVSTQPAQEPAQPGQALNQKGRPQPSRIPAEKPLESAAHRPEPAPAQRQPNQSEHAGPKAESRDKRRSYRHRRSPERANPQGQPAPAGLRARLDPRRAATPEQRQELYFAWKEAMASGIAAQWFGSSRCVTARRQARHNRQFVRAYEDRVNPLPAAAQTRQQLTFQAVKLAARHQADPRALYQTLKAMRPAAERGLVSIEWRRLFPKAPRWNPARYWKAPVVVLGRARPPRRRWGKVLWKLDLGLGQLRIQQRKLFPQAPQWSPVHNRSLPALRLAKKAVESSHHVRPATSPAQDRDHGQSH